MPNNCLVTKLKATVNNDKLPYLEKGVIFYDSNIGTAEAGFNNYNGVRVGTPNVEDIDSTIFEMTHPSNIKNCQLRVKENVTVPNNYIHTMYYKLDDCTWIQGINGTGYQADYLKFKLRLMDIIRCVNIEKIEAYGMLFSDTDSPNIEALSTLTKCSYIDVTGKTSPSWVGDIVTFTDSLITNGVDISQIPVIVLGNSNYSKFTINGTKISGTSRYEHIVFASEGHYSIYTSVDSYTPLTPQEYEAMTPAYTK